MREKAEDALATTSSLSRSDLFAEALVEKAHKQGLVN
jgi:hypothetical protein